jgi:hypothetical protein
MILYASFRAREGDDATDKSIAEKMGIAAETISRWNQISEFHVWLDDAVASARTPIVDLLELVARERISDFRFWEALAKKYGFFGSNCETTQTITLKYSI